MLRRCTYNFTFDRIDSFANMTASQAVDELFSFPALQFPDGPLSWHDGSPIFKVPATRQNLGEEAGLFNEQDFHRATRLWMFYETMYDPSIRMKLAYWLHSLFVTAFRGRWPYYNWALLVQSTAGSLKSLGFKMTLDNQMMEYLDNRSNRKFDPNENYAREFLELFTILRGPQVETGNYTNYTEADISTAARLLTGWKMDDNQVDPETGLPTSRPEHYDHDADPKTFSAAFGNQTIAGALDANDMYRELQDFVNMVYNQQETARAFLRRFYRFFVSDVITPEIESDIIDPLATQLRGDDYILEPTLKRLLKSEHFYDEDDTDSSDEIIGAKLKSPLELYISSIMLWEGDRLDLTPNNATYLRIFKEDERFQTDFMRDMGMDPTGPQTVEGYFGFYKAPGYSNNWYNSTTNFYRYTIGESLLRGTVRKSNQEIPFKVDIVPFVDKNISNPSDANALVRELLEHLLPEYPAPDRINYFLGSLLGQGDANSWSQAWTSFKSNGNDTEVKEALENLFDTIMRSVEFQTF